MKPLCDIDRRCEFCDAPLVRKRSAKGKLEPPKLWARRRFCGNACSRSSKRRDFWEYVEKGEGCWLWRGGINNKGYGTYDLVGGRHGYAHRHAYELLVGPIPEGFELDHLCRNPPCVNPDHLEPVTHAENLRRSVNAKLSALQVAEIRRRRAVGETVVALGLEFGVHSSQISRAARGLAWGDAS